MLTPNRKKAGKALARRSKRKLAGECLRDDKTRHSIILSLQKLIQTELKKLSSMQSSLLDQSPDTLKSFTWNAIYDELKKNAPIFLSFLMAATQTKTPRSNRIAVMCVCASVILKYRFKRINLFQKIVSLVLYAGHCSKQVSLIIHILKAHE